VNPCQNAFALTVDDATGYISLPNLNKHEEIVWKNTQMLAFDCSIDHRNRIYVDPHCISSETTLRRKKPKSTSDYFKTINLSR
jgi:hypothetical protein